MLEDQVPENKHFRLQRFEIPTPLQIIEQLQTINSTLTDPHLINYFELPEEFYCADTQNTAFNDYSLAYYKMQRLLHLLNTISGDSINDCVEKVCEMFQGEYPKDFAGTEVLIIDDQVLISVYNEYDLALQIQMRIVDDVWIFERLSITYRVGQNIIEFRTNYSQYYTLVIFANDQLGVVPYVRDRFAIGTIQYTEFEDDFPMVRLVKSAKIAHDDYIETISDSMVISPSLGRNVQICRNGFNSESLYIIQIPDGLEFTLVSREKTKTLTVTINTIKVTQSTTEASISESIDLFRNIAKQTKASKEYILTYKDGYTDTPASTRVNYFEDEAKISTFEVRFKTDSSIDAIIIDGKVYLWGEFCMYLSPNQYYIFVINESLERFGIHFREDFTIEVEDSTIEPVFEIVQDSVPLPLSNLAGLSRKMSLN